VIRPLLVVPVLLLAAGCSGGSGEASAPTPCAGLPTADPAAAMPPGLPPVDGQVLYASETQGKTEIVYGLLPTKDFVKVRDDYVTALKGAGWTIDGTDQESVEAEAQFSKKPPLQAGTIKVTPASCSGYVTVRYKVNL
jgi:hypothetical protein